jgi:hypothetical protein
MKRKYLISILSITIFVCGIIGVNVALAASTDNVSGWAWGSTIGWISFNGDNYGVHICTGDSDSHAGCGAGTDGKMVGYAWSSNIGWIKFDPVGPYPSSPSNAARVDGSGNITGWIRACAGAANADCSGGTNPLSGGWDGWIKLSNVTIDFTKSPAEFHGYAWGSDVVGWISFNCAEGGISGGNICGQSNYKVITTYASKPKAINLDIRQTDDYCVAGPSITTSWTFVGNSQSAYQVQIFEGNFATLVKDSGKVTLSSNSFSTIENIKYNKTYSWQVQVWDSLDRSSGWIKDTKTVTTPAHQYPNIKTVGFSWLPVNPAQGEDVRFVNNGKCYGAGGGEVPCSWLWSIPNATPNSSTEKEPVVKFNSAGDKLIKVKATDPDGLYCEASALLKVSVQLPKWKEITPF